MGCRESSLPSTCRRRSAGTDSRGKGLPPHPAEFPPYAVRCRHPPSVPEPSASARCRGAPKGNPYVYGPLSGAVPNRPSRKKGRQTTHRRDFPDSVIITRERHPFEGCALAVIGSIRRRGVLFVLACLPDGSRALIPAQWTDWDEGHCGGVRACQEANVGARALGSLGDLLQLRHLIDALRGRSIGVGTATEGEPSCN